MERSLANAPLSGRVQREVSLFLFCFQPLFMEKQSKLPQYCGEMRCLGEQHRQAITVDLTDDGEAVRLGVWKDDSATESSDLSLDRARELANHLLKAVEVAEKFAKSGKVLTRGRIRVTIATEDEVPYSTPCDGQVRRLYFEGKEYGEWRELGVFEQPDMKDIRALMDEADKVIADLDPIE